MKWLKNNLTLSLVLGLLVALCGVGAMIVRAEAHTRSELRHVDGQNYIPRAELEEVQESIDHRLDAQDTKLDDIHDDVKHIQQWLLDNR